MSPGCFCLGDRPLQMNKRMVLDRANRPWSARSAISLTRRPDLTHARREGEAEGRTEVARRLLAMGMDVETVQDATPA